MLFLGDTGRSPIKFKEGDNGGLALKDGDNGGKPCDKVVGVFFIMSGFLAVGLVGGSIKQSSKIHFVD